MALLIYIVCVIIFTVVHYGAFNAYYFKRFGARICNNEKGDFLLLSVFCASLLLVGLFVVFCSTNFFQYGFKWSMED